MANCCYVVYKCVGEAEQLKKLSTTLKNIKEKTVTQVQNKWGKTWLGGLVAELGGDIDEHLLRGRIIDFGYEQDVLTIVQETDWEEQRALRCFLKNCFPEIDIYYSEEEPCGKVFSTNDENGILFPYKYLLDSYDEPQYYRSLDEAAQAVATIVGYEVAAEEEEIDDALDKFIEEQEEEETFFSFHKFELGDTSLLTGVTRSYMK